MSDQALTYTVREILQPPQVQERDMCLEAFDHTTSE